MSKIFISMKDYYYYYYWCDHSLGPRRWETKADWQGEGVREWARERD